MQSTNGYLVDYSDDEAWRDLGRSNQLYKLWLIGCTMEPWLEGALEVIQVIHKLILSDSISIIMIDLSNRDQLRSYCLYNTSIGVIVNGLKKDEKLLLRIGGISFYFSRFPGTSNAYAINYYLNQNTGRQNTRNIQLIYSDKYDWMIYDYLLMLSEKQFFCLDTGPITNRTIYDDITQPDLISVIVDDDS
jgi:hypothetical protein